MTEKDYSGATTSKIGKNAKAKANSQTQTAEIKTRQKESREAESESGLDTASYKRAGEISSKVKEFAKLIVKKDILLSEIAEKIEAEIRKLGGELAFPVNLSIDDIAAHYTPTLRDETRASGLMKVDLGVHVKGCIADIAFTIDLTPEKKHAKLIEASKNALKAALEEVKKSKEKTTLSQIGKAIQKTIEKAGFSPIVNLSGHGLSEYNIHSGITIPNYDTGSDKELGEGAYAIEPFATLSSGSGSIYEGPGSNIYTIARISQPRDNFAREVLDWILENKKTLPFSQRELEKKFTSKVLIAISNLKRAGIISEFPQLIEKNHQVISQAETSLIVHNGVVEVLVEP